MDPRPATARIPTIRSEEELLRQAAEAAIAYRASLPERRVGVAPDLDGAALRRELDRGFGEEGVDPGVVIDELVRAAEPGLVAMSSPRYFGFVIGGSVPAALAADWLTSTWDQNTALRLATPATAIIEEVAGRWLVDLLGLPAGTSYGFVSGATMGNVTGLAAARHAVLRAAGWDVEEDGLLGAPEVEVVVGAHAHASLVKALRVVGFGRGRPRRVATDDQGRMLAAELRSVLASIPAERPVIVAAQAGEVNTGAFDPLESIVEAVRARRNAWLHVDGAFGLWAAASPAKRDLIRGHDGADSWSTDAHKWLNVPYDSGLVFVRDAAAHRAAMSLTAAYLPAAPGDERDPTDWVPELSRRARAVPVYAALRSLGRAGVAELVDRTCRVAAEMAAGLAAAPGVEVLNDVVLNQVLVAFGDDAATERVIQLVQEDGTCWAGGTTWRGRRAMRISVSNWATTSEDGDRSVEAILRCHRAAGGGSA